MNTLNYWPLASRHFLVPAKPLLTAKDFLLLCLVLCIHVKWSKSRILLMKHFPQCIQLCVSTFRMGSSGLPSVPDFCLPSCQQRHGTQQNSESLSPRFTCLLVLIPNKVSSKEAVRWKGKATGLERTDLGWSAGLGNMGHISSGHFYNFSKVN